MDDLTIMPNISELINCPYTNCNHSALAERTDSCPSCKQGLLWCDQCGSANQVWATYCRACGGKEQRQKLPTKDWRMLKGNPQLTSSTHYSCAYPETGDMIKVLWIASLNQDIKSPPISAYGLLICLSSDGKLFFLRESDGNIMGPMIRLEGESVSAPAIESWNLYAASNDVLVAYDLRSNTEIWRYSISDGIFASDIVANDGLAVVCSYCPATGKAYVLGFSAAQKEPRWAIPLEGEGTVTTPVFIGSRFMVGREDGSLFFIGAQGSARPSVVKAAAPCGIPGGLNMLVSPVCNYGKVYFVNTDGELYGVSFLEDGIQIQRTIDLQTRFIYGLAASRSFLCVTCHYGLAVFDQSFRKQWDTWEREDVEKILSPAVISGETAFAASTNGNAFFCRMAETKPTYQLFRFADTHQGRVHVLASCKNFYIVSDSGEITALTVREDS